MGHHYSQLDKEYEDDSSYRVGDYAAGNYTGGYHAGEPVNNQQGLASDNKVEGSIYSSKAHQVYPETSAVEGGSSSPPKKKEDHQKFI